MVKSIPPWIHTSQLSVHLLTQFTETLTHLIQISPVSFAVVELCFQIIDLMASELISKW